MRRPSCIARRHQYSGDFIQVFRNSGFHFGSIKKLHHRRDTLAHFNIFLVEMQ